MRLNVFLLIVVLFSYSTSLFALEIEFVGDNVTVTNLAKKEEEKPFKLASTGDAFIDENIIRAVIGVNRKTTDLNFRLVAKYRTLVKIKWDNEDVVFMSRQDSNRDFYLAYPGQSYFVTLRATKAVSGNLYLLNENDQVIATYPYQVVHERPYRQSVRFGINQSYNDSVFNGNSDKDEDRQASASYFVTQKQRFDDQGLWNAGVSINSDLDDDGSNNKSISGSIGYTW